MLALMLTSKNSAPLAEVREEACTQNPGSFPSSTNTTPALEKNCMSQKADLYRFNHQLASR